MEDARRELEEFRNMSYKHARDLLYEEGEP
jgi:hypothetical protein